MADKKPSSRIWDFLLIFAVVYLGSQFAFNYFFPSEQTPVEGSGAVVLSMEDSSMRLGQTPIAIIQNNSAKNIAVIDRCPLPPFDVFRVGEGNSVESINTEDTAIPCEAPKSIPAGESVTYSLAPWKQSMFSSVGVYEIELPLELNTSVSGSGSISGTGAAIENSQYREGIIARFSIEEPGFFTKIFRAFITKPLLNAIIFLASILPGYSLGWAIVILTLAVKILLYIPTKHALEGQKKMQLLQPKFEEVKRTYKDDPVKMQQETMKIWKENKVNPMQSCLPMLVQFPILIGLFYVIRDGVHLQLSQHLVYPVYQNLDWSFNTSFLGFDLNQSYPFIFPPLLVILQFIQMKLSFMIADKKKSKELAKKVTPEVDTAQEVQQRIMTYALPLLIGFFALQYPSALSLYWGISTLFAIGQQVLVNREHVSLKKA